MQVVTFLIVVVVGIGAVWAQLPHPCTPPAQFRARASEFDHGRNIVRRFNLTYDETNERKYIVEEIRNSMPGEQFFTYIVLGKPLLLYIINHQTKKCTKSPITGWSSIAIAPNSTFEDELTYGGPGELLAVTEWSDRVPLRKQEALLVEFSMKNCYPVRFVQITRGNITATMTDYYYDIQLGIPDPSVFTPPPECQTAPWVSTPHILGF